jgi:hypothetical protein
MSLEKLNETENEFAHKELGFIDQAFLWIFHIEIAMERKIYEREPL